MRWQDSKTKHHSNVNEKKKIPTLKVSNSPLPEHSKKVTEVLGRFISTNISAKAYENKRNKLHSAEKRIA